MAAAAFAALAWSSSAEAAVSTGLPGLATGAPTLVEPVHGAHRDCQWRRNGGWHYHRNVGQSTFPCARGGRGYRSGYVWRCRDGRCDWWHPSHRRWRRQARPA